MRTEIYPHYPYGYTWLAECVAPQNTGRNGKKIVVFVRNTSRLAGGLRAVRDVSVESTQVEMIRAVRAKLLPGTGWFCVAFETGSTHTHTHLPSEQEEQDGGGATSFQMENCAPCVLAKKQDAFALHSLSFVLMVITSWYPAFPYPSPH